MSDDLTAFLAGRKPNVVDEVEWEMLRLRVSAYLDGECPPMRYITSARAVVMRDEQVLVAEDRDGQRHILPGGRLEAGELPDVALRREIAEETGWQVGDIQPLGFVQYRHLTPKPPDYRYPYPSFVQVVYRTEGDAFDAGVIIADDYVVGAAFRPASEVRLLPLSPVDRLFLHAALRWG